MNVKRIAMTLLPGVLLWAACSQSADAPAVPSVDAPAVPSADAVKSIVIMTRVPGGHPQVEHVENQEHIAQVVEFVTEELLEWGVPVDGDGREAITNVAFEGHDGQILYHLFVGEDWVSADDATMDSAYNPMARVDPATAERLRSLLESDDADP